MPQLNIGDFAPQLIWLAIVFVALYLAMANIALPRIGEVIDERNARINGDIAAAQSLKAQTEAAINAYEQALADARARGAVIVGKTRDDLSAKMAADRSALDRDIAAKNAEAEARILALKADSVEKVQVIARDAASAVIEKILGSAAAKTDVDAALASVAAR
ncbi:MAG: F0F1 ATP synthase subunit B' [Chitinophagales bacterium]|nr:F0F1 ATP synthase subunit B' [Hyphomicrobiales bacterium]